MSPPSERTLRVIDRFKNHAASQDGYPGARRAAVLIPLFVNDEGELEVILTVRSKKLKSHPGEVALPGGKAEESDRDLVETAFREAYEEIGLPFTAHTYLTTLQPFLSKHLLIVTPIVSLLHPSAVPFVPIIQPSEVHATFTAPLQRFISSRNYIFSVKTWNETTLRFHYFDPPHYFPADPSRGTEYSVTGLTASILIHATKVGFGFFSPQGDGSEGENPEPDVECEVLEYPLDSRFANAPPTAWMDEMVASMIAKGKFTEEQLSLRVKPPDWREAEKLREEEEEEGEMLSRI